MNQFSLFQEYSVINHGGGSIDVIKRKTDYTARHCWQYDIRLKNLDEDLALNGLTHEITSSLKVSDFEFREVSNKDEREILKSFIMRHEWLGNLSQYTTHWFGAYYKKHLAGVILFNLPNSFSKLLGEDTPEIERLISRGACVSWSPKCLASSFMMWCINWMVQNTPYRLFTAYSDPEALELGTIYQACNFYYLGCNSGAKFKYVNPYSKKTVSDRWFRSSSAYRRFAREMGIIWQPSWNKVRGQANIDAIPEDVMTRLREYSRQKQKSLESLTCTPKHKYAYVLGRDKKETKLLRKKFLEMNKTYPYPKERGK